MKKQTPRRLAIVGLFIGGVVACSDDVAPARAQWVVAIDTDAPVPAFGDRLLVEVLTSDGNLACSGCRQLFGVTRETSWPVTFGILPEALAPDTVTHVRARLYRTDHAGFDGQPRDASHIDALGLLPKAAATGPTNVIMQVRVDCFAVPSSLEARATIGVAQTCDPEVGKLGSEPVLAAPIPNTKLEVWAPARRTTCTFNVPPEMACIDGGAFLMGDVRVLSRNERVDAVPEHLVALSPYAMDKLEFTVGAYRELLNKGATSVSVLTRADRADCTYLGPTASENDALPLNCVSAAGAEALCTTFGGKRLPTEAEWEFAAGARDEERLYPWGDLQTACDRSAVGLGRDVYEGITELDQSSECRYPPSGGQRRPWGPIPVGWAAESTPEGLRDMGGNVSEWVADGFFAYTESCWEGRLFVNPKCDRVVPNRSRRGGAWALPPGASSPGLRLANNPTDKVGDVGFRCARSE